MDGVVCVKPVVTLESSMLGVIMGFMLIVGLINGVSGMALARA